MGALTLLIVFADEIGEALVALGKGFYEFVKFVVDAFYYPLEKALEYAKKVGSAIGGMFGFGDEDNEKVIKVRQESEAGTFVEPLGGGRMTMMAKGGTVGPRGQIALVGEEGPEIVALPPNSAVVSNPDSKKIAGFADGTTTLKNIVSQVNNNAASQPDMSSMFNQLVGALKPMLQEIASATNAVAKNAGGDIYLDGKKVGRQLEGQMVAATEKKMSKIILGR